MIFKTEKGKEFETEERCFIIEIINDVSERNISFAQARVEPGITTQLHALDVDEYYYILEGEGEMNLDHDIIGKVNKGDLVKIKKGLAQQIKNTGQVDLVFLCVCSPRFRQEGYVALSGH